MATNFYQCANCHVKKFSYRKLIKHLKLYHECEPNFKVTCGLGGCPRQYTKTKSLKAHILIKHPQESVLIVEDETEVEDQSSLTFDFEDFEDVEEVPSFESQCVQLTKSFKHYFAFFLLKLQEKHVVPRAVLHTVVDDVQNLFEFFNQQYNEILKTCLQQETGNINPDSRIASVLGGTSLLDQCFDELNTEYKLEHFCKKELGVIQPKEYVLGQDVNGKKETFQYISILEVLKCILVQKETWLQINDVDSTPDGIIADFRHGTIYKSHPLLSSSNQHLSIQLYNDEFEVVNPLGSKKSLHKVSAFYFLLGNIQPKYKSQLKNIHVAILVRNKLVQKYGFGDILKPLISDLNLLQLEGINVAIEGIRTNVKGSVASISADNLSAHMLAGFSGSFSNGRICRYCMCHYRDMSVLLDEDVCVLRTSANHNYHLKCIEENPNNKSLYGVNGPCPFSVLLNFDVTKAFPPDVMHDFLEGIVPLVLRLVIRQLHISGTVRIAQINTELENFKFGKNDTRNKPVVLSTRILQDAQISGKATEKWTLLRVLPFLIGKYVGEENEVWKLYLLIREIGDIILAPALKESWISYLQCLVTQFLAEFKRLFPENFTPKIHYLVHYPRLILEFGPPRSHWCMRFEGKHLYFKKLASVLNNFKNICFSLAKRYGMRQCLEWQTTSNDYCVSLRSSTEVPVQNLPTQVKSILLQRLSLTSLEDCETVWKTKEVVLDTVKYAVGDYFFLDLLHEEEIPQIIKVLHVLKFRELWWICGRLYKTLAFNTHMHAYTIVQTSEWIAFRPGEEVDFHAVDGYFDEDDNLFVTLHHRPLKYNTSSSDQTSGGDAEGMRDGTVNQTPSVTAPALNMLPKFPQVLQAALNNRDEKLRSFRKSKVRAQLIQVLFDHMSQHTLYPSHKQYVELLSLLVSSYPFLREKIGSGYDALHESLKNKFKKERRPLADEEAVSKMKRKFGMAASKRATHSTPAAELQRTNRRATIDDLDFDVGEDDRSIQAHIQTMQTESEKVRPNWAILEDLMKRTCVFRKKYVSSHTTGNVLETFPCLKLPKMLFFDMNLSFKVDVDRMLSTNLQKFASQIINVAGESRLKTQCLEIIEECLEDSKRDDLCLSAAIALLPGLFKENLSSLLIMDRMPDIPTPSISVHGCTLQNPLTGRRIIVHMDGYEILKEDVSGDLSFGLSAAFALFFVFGVKYPTDLRKTLLFLEHFIFKLEPSEKIPVTLKRVYNSLCQ